MDTMQLCSDTLTDCTKPIDRLSELLAWSSSTVSRCATGEPLNLCLSSTTNDNRPRTLVCHDMAGGYLDDRFSHGCVADTPYYITEWQYIDIFVYFSHHLVTVPPVGWINAAHIHNTTVLGTFITEWDNGSLICEEFLSDRSKTIAVADKLTEIAATHRFDGWLINIENPINCKSAIGRHTSVIWYDSVTINGDLVWQNELNDLNKAFFDVCDGIFLNYNWTQEKLKSSVLKAGERIRDVYVGVDVFGRGCFGGGGFNSALALGCARKEALSVAIFAPGWVHETLPKRDFQQNQSK